MVLEKLGSSLYDALQKVFKAAVVDEDLVKELVRNFQRALLQADVNVQLVMELSQQIQKRALDEIYFKRVLDGDDVVKVRKAIDEMGVRDECEALVAEHRDEAVAALDAPEVSDDGRARIVDYIDSLIG